ncbi:hypothetical protein [Serratia fonticola]
MLPFFMDSRNSTSRARVLLHKVLAPVTSGKPSARVVMSEKPSFARVVTPDKSSPSRVVMSEKPSA